MFLLKTENSVYNSFVVWLWSFIELLQKIILILLMHAIAGGSCGYGDLVSQPPFSSMVTGIGPSLYESGKECGACYQVIRIDHIETPS